jgi:hypothetical protein
MEVELFSETLLRNNKTTSYPNMERRSLQYPAGLRFRHACIRYNSNLQAMERDW